MQKTKFKVTINANGEHTDALIKIIGNHNAGEENASVSLLTLADYVKARAAQYPTLMMGKEVVKWDFENNIIHVCKDVKSLPYLTIEECTYDELGAIGTITEDDLLSLMPEPEELEQIEDVANISQQGNQC